MPGTMADIGHLDQIIRDDPVNDTVSIFGSQQGPITLEGIEHSRTYLGKIAQEIELGNNLILDRKRKGRKFFLSPRKEFNPSWHVWPFWL